MSGYRFHELVSRLTKIGLDYHREAVLRNTAANLSDINYSIREIRKRPSRCMVISAGPSLRRQRILERLPDPYGCIVATDGAYLQCLEAGVYPEFVVTLDPHPTRMVKWFGDPNYADHLNGDDYFARQDLNVTLREQFEKKNQEHIELVNKCCDASKFILATTAPAAVVKRLRSITNKLYWFAPLVDDPGKDGLTRQMVEMTGLPAMNTGGTVGTAAWVFAQTVLQCKDIAVCGMDFGYPIDTPFKNTQEWNMLKGEKNIHEYYPHFTSPFGMEYYTSPTYWWYRHNFLDLLKASGSTVTNVSEAGLLSGEGVICKTLDEWLKS